MTSLRPHHPRGGLARLSGGTLHLSIDMQRLFAEPTAWHTPALADILPAVTRLAEARPEQTMFARFMTPATPAQAQGRWRHYYERWSSVTGDRSPAELLDLVTPLAELAGSGRTVEKTTYSAFATPGFIRKLEDLAVDTIVITGVETDVCVLASVFDAVDLGYRVIVPVDAVASSSGAAHEAVLRHVLPRLAEQVDLSTVDEVLRCWPA